MAKTSAARDRKSAEVRRLAAAGVSQRQIAARLGISRPMVQRILDSYDPAGVDESEVADFRRELIESLDAVWVTNGRSFLCGGVVDPMLYRLEAAENAFNAEYGLFGARAVQAARLRRMIAEGCLSG